MSNMIEYGSTAREKLKAGIDKICNAVKVTLGPKGRNAVLDRKFGPPHITKDGVTVAKAIFLKDPWERIGSEIVKDVASKTNDDAGDGTTTATVLAQAIIDEGFKKISKGVSPVMVMDGINRLVDVLSSFLMSKAIKVDTDEQIRRVADISSNGDFEIADNITKAIKEVGKNGVINIEESPTPETTVDITTGLEYDRGYMSQYFCTDTTKMEVVLDNPYILLYNNKILTASKLVHIMETVAIEKRPLLIIAIDVEAEALSTLVVNRMNGLDIAAIKAPMFGEQRREVLEDIAVSTGATVITTELGIELDEVGIEMLGTAGSVIIKENSCRIIEGSIDEERFEERVTLIKNQIEQKTKTYTEQFLRERYAKLISGVARIRVGASTEFAMKEKLDRYNDALSATKAAIKGGIIVGGGIALLRSIDKIKNVVTENEYEIARDILSYALTKPYEQIVTNAGIEVENEKVLGSKEFNYGYNAKTNEYCDLFEQGVIDPVLVTITALKNATSIASLLLTTETVVASEDDPNVKYNVQEV